MEADGWHVLSDFYTTIGIGAALLIVHFTKIEWLDPVLAIIVAGLLAATGYKLVKESSTALLDAEDPELVAKIVEHFGVIQPADIISVHDLRTLRAGRYTHVDLHLVVPEFYTTGQAHELVETFGRNLLKAAHLEGECHTHTDPCQMSFCASCKVDNCPIRKEPFLKPSNVTADTATAPGDF